MRFCFQLPAFLALSGCLMAAGLDGFSGAATTVVRADRRTGRLVRVVATPKTASPAPAPAKVPAIVEDVARLHGLDPLLVHSVIQAESGYDPFALSPKGAQGLMQLMPATARRLGVADAFDIRQNLQGGAEYLKYLLDLFGDQQLALAAYNAGEQAVIRHGGVPPYRETRDYVKRVGGAYSDARKPAVPAGPAAAMAPPEPEYRPLEYYFDARGDLHVLTR